MGVVDRMWGRALLAGGVVLLLVFALSASGASASSAPSKLKFAGQFGREVNATQAGNGLEAEDVCLAASGDTCQAGKEGAAKESAAAGTFKYPVSVAVEKATGDIYVDDRNNQRIQKLGPKGEFLLMWGSGVKKGGGGICTEASECQAGTPGSGAGQMDEPSDVAVDNTNGNVYVLDKLNNRIDEFSSEGQFILMFGGEVNKKAKGDVCLAAESSECQAGKVGTANGFFPIWPQFQGNLLAVGGSEDLVYVADEGRVQEFDHNGAYKTQVSLTSTKPAFPAGGRVTGLAVDGSGNLFVTESYLENTGNQAFGAPTGVYEFAPGNAKAVAEIDTSNSHVEGIAVDESGHLAITDGMAEGLLIDLAGGQPTRFGPPEGMAGSYEKATGLSFNGQGALYLADTGRQDVEMYEPKLGAELLTDASASEGSCKEGVAKGAFATTDCALRGEVDPWGVTETEAWFEWGLASPSGNKTPPVKIANTKPAEGEEEPQVQMSDPLTGLLPNQTVYYRLAAFDHNFPNPESLVTPATTFVTPTAPPRIIGDPGVLFVKSASATFTGEVNPENARTEYFVEYGAPEALARCSGGMSKETCAGVASTSALQSERYANVSATFGATGLRPGTTYRFRLMAVNGKEQVAVDENGGSTLPEGEFTTAPPVNPQAATSGASNVTATGAVISGQVDPDGEPASYAFELGVYRGASTQYGIVESAAAGEGSAFVEEKLQLSDLQPNTTYAYRVKIESAYGTSYGMPLLFTTEGLSAVLKSPSKLGVLPVPDRAFPNEPGTAPAKMLTRAQRLKKALRACRRQHNAKRRKSCERRARRQLGPKANRKRRRTR